MLAENASRRDFMGHLGLLGAGAGVASLLAGCNPAPQPLEGTSAAGTAAGGTSRPKLRACFSNAGLQSTWCSLGKTTAELWGKMLDVDIVWLDGEFDPEKQRNRIDGIVSEPWDFCVFQAVQEELLAEPCRRLKERGIPVISMDVNIVPLDKQRDSGVWTHITADQVFMGESSTRYMLNKIGGKGKVIHIGGLAAHSGAQGRATGFKKALADFPGVSVVGGDVRWCDWKTPVARDTFDILLSQETEPIAGAFFHSDDMALACLPAIKDTIHKDMVITAVDGQKQGLESIREKGLGASTVNPVCSLHSLGVIIGQFICRNSETVDQLPLQIIAPGPLVSLDSGNLDAMLYLANPAHCLV